MPDHDPNRTRRLVGLLILTSITVVTLDARHDTGPSPIDPLRNAVGTVIGPVERGANEVLRPITSIPAHFDKLNDLRRRADELQAANEALQSRLEVADVSRRHTAQLVGISSLGDDEGLALVNARVVAIGPAQSFSRTVTIDAGTSSGIVPDLTVVNAEGLVGRVVEATSSTATVLLVVDSESTVGGRLGKSMELGFLTGDGSLAGDGSLELSLVDHTVTPRVGDTVVTWGSHGGAPYVAEVPVGRVVSVQSSPAELTQTAQIQPFVDFSSLDEVAVVTGMTPSHHQEDVAAGGGP